MGSSNLIVVVSGGSRGLGQTIVQRLLARGDCVATFARSTPDWFRQAVDDAQTGPRFHFATVDARDTAAIVEFVSGVRKRFGRVDALVNNAGTAADGVLATMPEKSIDAMLEVNLRASIVLTKECCREMLLSNGGSIVNITSIIAQRGFSGLAVYSATKAALEGMTRSLARELGSRGIRINCVAPGFLETEMSKGLSPEQKQQIVRRTPLGRLGTCDEVADVVEFFLDPTSQFITGQTIVVDGGASV